MYDDFVTSIFKCDPETPSHGNRHLMLLHQDASSKKDPVVLELGTETGGSTKIFLNAIHKHAGGALVSVDIADCSNVVQSPRWTFVQSDSTDVDSILERAPVLKSGIDVLFIDSLHCWEHVRKELFGFFPYVKDGGSIYFDDVDSIPYMRGRKKDNIHTEMGNRAILDFVHRTFEANLDKLYFTLYRGSTGLVRLEKRAALGEQLCSELLPPARTSKRYWKLKRSFDKRFARFGLELP